ncbi:MAG: integrase core domain-containing protein, partial [Candidatus Omnitrophica bacterium]|nr:integrase core domain-containing protein [Candidatus Omnitrophota bacterium]
KEDLIWLKQEQWDTPFDVEEDLKVWIERYNTDYPHSSLGYKTPVQYEKEQFLLTTKIQLDKWGSVQKFVELKKSKWYNF